MTRYTYGPVAAVQLTPSSSDDPTAIGVDTAVPVPITRTLDGAAELDLQTWGRGTANLDGTVTPDSTGLVGVKGPDGYTGPLFFSNQSVLPNELTTGAGLADGSVTDVKVATAAAIDLAKTADSTASTGRLAMTSAERTKLATINLTGAVAGQLLQVSTDGTTVTPVSIDTLGLVQDGDLPPDLHGLEFLAVGAPIPAGLTSETLIARVAAPTFGFTAVVGSAGASTVTTTTGITVTTTTAIASGQKISIAIGASAEGTGAVSTWTVTTPTNVSGAGLSNSHIQGTTSQTALLVAYASADIAVGATFVIKPDSARSDVCVLISTMTGVLQTGALDQTATNGGGAATAFSVGPTAATTASSEVAIAAFSYNPGSPTTPTRVFGATGTWTQAGATVLSTDTGPRALAVVYLVLTSTQTVTATGSVTGTGGTTAYSSTLATYKAA